MAHDTFDEIWEQYKIGYAISRFTIGVGPAAAERIKIALRNATMPTSLRDQLAMAALTRWPSMATTSATEMAETAYEIADAMLVARSAKGSKDD